MIPFKVLPIGEKEIKAVELVLRSKNISMGKVVKELEERFADYIDTKYAVAVDSCTSALFLSLKYKFLINNEHPPMPVKIPSMTVPLVANTIEHTNAQIHFTDDCDWVGNSYELKPYNIIDSAHKVVKNQFYNCDNETLMCFSFYPTKPITSCEGGMICTNDIDAVSWLKKARWYGRNEGETLIKNSWEYDIEFAGWKMNMTDIQAAIAIEQLKRLDVLNKNRQDVVDLYNKLLSKNNDSLYLYRIQVNDRNLFIKYMKDNGVECGIHFKPLHYMKAFSNCEKDDLSKTEIMANKTVSLPLYDSLTEYDIVYITMLVKDWEYKYGE